MKRRRRLLAATGAALVCACASASHANADYTSDLRWSLGESVSTYGNGQQFHISAGGRDVDYRWLDDDLTKTTVISGNNCTDYTLWGKSTFGPGDTSYHTLFAGFPGLCFVVRGRTDSGTTIAHDARLRR